MKQSYLFILFLVAPFLSLAQDDLIKIREDHKEKINETLKKKKITGATVAVVSSEGILWIDNFGFADAENKLPVSEETLFGIGSITKVFTSTAVMQLEEKGEIDLDKPLDQYLPSFQLQDGTRGVTPRNMLTHHSGIPSDIFNGMFSHQPEDYKKVAEYMSKEYMAGTPNEIRSYSNPGYTLLGNMVSEVSGIEYSDYIQQNILQPLGMNRSRFNALDDASKTYDKKGEVTLDAMLRDIPAGGLFSSASDMAKFLQAYMSQSKTLLEKETYSKILAQQHLDAILDFSNRYALGWDMTSRPHAGDIFTHTGTTLYFNAAIAFSPLADIGVVVLTNSEKGGNLFYVANSMIEEIAESKGLPKTDKQTPELGSKERVNKSAAELDEFVGIYASPGAYVKVFRKNKRLLMKLQGLRAVLIPVENDMFIAKVILFRMIPIRLGDQRFLFEDRAGYRLLTNIEEGSDKELIAQKLTPQSIPDEWLSLIGNYEPINERPGEVPYFKDYKLSEKDNLLILSFESINEGQNIEMVLEFVTENRAKIAGLGRYGGQSVTHQEGIIEAFGYQLKKQ